MHGRSTAVYCLLLSLFAVAIFRVYFINASGRQVEASGAKGSYSLDIGRTRGVIYDRNMNKMVNQSRRYLAAILPTAQAAAALLPEAETPEERESLLARLTGGLPFVEELPHGNIYADGVDVLRVPKRYEEQTEQLAPHVLGYLNGSGQNGVAGIEGAYDSFLADTGARIAVRYPTDAVGHIMEGAGAGIDRKGAEEPVGGVVLTLDSDIQKLTRNALAAGCDKGAAVVMDVMNGDILAMASLPVFDQNDIADSFAHTDAPFINRATSGFNIGSAFKLVVSAAALEAGISSGHTYQCNGYVEIDGITFRCNNHAVHGEIAMERALQVSCNTYFINLAQQMRPEFLISVAQNMGFGTAQELAANLWTQPGNLPEARELVYPAAYANFSFGQGSSLASPLQMAQAVAILANTGVYVTPRLVQGFTLDGETLSEAVPLYGANQVMSERTSQRMRALMTATVEGGSGRTAKPLQGGAGGKTSSAQTGQYVGEEEIVHAWFAGFYPAQSPRYAIVVLVEGGESGERVAAPIFRRIADGISGLGSGRSLGLSGQEPADNTEQKN